MKYLKYLLFVFVWYPPLYGIIPLNVLIIVLILLIYPNRVFKYFYYSPISRKFYITYASVLLLILMYQIVFDLSGSVINDIYINIINAVIAPLLYVIILNEYKSARLKTSLYLLSYFTISIAFISIYNQTGIDIFSFDRDMRVSLPFINNTIAPTTFSIVLIFILATLIVKSEYLTRINYIILIVTYVLLIYFMSTRFIFVTLLTIFAIRFTYTFIVESYFFKTAMLLSVALLTLYLSDELLTINSKTMSRIDTLTEIDSIKSDESFATRVFLWSRALEISKNMPLGYGYSNFHKENQEFHAILGYRGLNTHNEFLLILIGSGWIGLLITGIFYYKLLLSTIKNSGYTVFLIVSTVILITGFFETYSNNIGSINITPILILFVGVSTINIQSYNKKYN
jgi:hypothetical protein